MDMMQPQAAGDQMMEEPGEESFTVCIECYPDGTFQVGMEQPAGEGMEQAEGGTEPGMKPARDVKTALTIALEIIKAGGKQGQAAGDFASGYDNEATR